MRNDNVQNEKTNSTTTIIILNKHITIARQRKDTIKITYEGGEMDCNNKKYVNKETTNNQKKENQ